MRARKVLAIILCLLLVCGMFPANAFAAGDLTAAAGTLPEASTPEEEAEQNASGSNDGLEAAETVASDGKNAVDAEISLSDVKTGEDELMASDEEGSVGNVPAVAAANEEIPAAAAANEEIPEEEPAAASNEESAEEESPAKDLSQGGASLAGASTVENVPYQDAKGKPNTAEQCMEVGTELVEWTEGWYVVNSSVTVSGRINVTGDVHLILGDGKTFSPDGGITVSGGSSLTIYGQEKGSGSLKIAFGKGMDGAAGIGGLENGTTGDITIHGGKLNVEGYNSAAIGTGRKGTPGTITITGGEIVATGGYLAAGIGGSNGSACGTVTITGGKVSANGGYGCPGIGGGYYDKYSQYSADDLQIAILGGGVTAKAGSEGNAAIGSYANAPGAHITLSWNGIGSYLKLVKLNGSDIADFRAADGKVTLLRDVFVGETMILAGEVDSASLRGIITPVGSYVTIGESLHGSFGCDKAPDVRVIPGETVTLTDIKADNGYVIGDFYYTVEDGDPVPILETEGVYSFAMPGENVTLTAHFWQENPVVTFHCNKFEGWADTPEPQQLAIGGKAVRPADIRVNGPNAFYTFKGWYLDKDGTEPFDFDSPVREDVTLYAGFDTINPFELFQYFVVIPETKELMKMREVNVDFWDYGLRIQHFDLVEGLDFDPERGVLTLDNYNGSAFYVYYNISREEKILAHDLTIEVKGTNNIEMTHACDYNTMLFMNLNSVTFTGNGTINFDALGTPNERFTFFLSGCGAGFEAIHQVVWDGPTLNVRNGYFGIAENSITPTSIGYRNWMGTSFIMKSGAIDVEVMPYNRHGKGAQFEGRTFDLLGGSIHIHYMLNQTLLEHPLYKKSNYGISSETCYVFKGYDEKHPMLREPYIDPSFDLRIEVDPEIAAYGFNAKPFEAEDYDFCFIDTEYLWTDIEDNDLWAGSRGIKKIEDINAVPGLFYDYDQYVGISPETPHTLVLNNYSGEGFRIRSRHYPRSKLNIEVNGDNVIYGNRLSGLWLGDVDVTFTGSGTLRFVYHCSDLTRYKNGDLYFAPNKYETTAGRGLTAITANTSEEDYVVTSHASSMTVDGPDIYVEGEYCAAVGYLDDVTILKGSLHLPLPHYFPLGKTGGYASYYPTLILDGDLRLLGGSLVINCEESPGGYDEFYFGTPSSGLLGSRIVYFTTEEGCFEVDGGTLVCAGEERVLRYNLYLQKDSEAEVLTGKCRKVQTATVEHGKALVRMESGRVFVTPLPEEGYRLASLSYVVDGKEPVEIPSTNGEFVFACPEGDLITVTAEFSDTVDTGEKLPIYPVALIENWEYGETPSEPFLLPGRNPGNGEVTYAYKPKGAPDSAYSGTVPTKAGHYTLRAEIAETEFYQGATSTRDFKIHTRVVEITGVKPKDKPYDGTNVCYLDFDKAWVSNVLEGDDVHVLKTTTGFYDSSIAYMTGENDFRVYHYPYVLYGEDADNYSVKSSANSKYGILLSDSARILPAEVPVPMFATVKYGSSGSFSLRVNGYSGCVPEKVWYEDPGRLLVQDDDEANVLNLANTNDLSSFKDKEMHYKLAENPGGGERTVRIYVNLRYSQGFYSPDRARYRFKMAIELTVTDKEIPKLTVADISGTYGSISVSDADIVGTAMVGETAIPGTWSFVEGGPFTNVSDSGTKTVLFTPEDTENYAGGKLNCKVSISQKEVKVKADPKEKYVGEEDPELTATVTGLAGEDTVAYTLTRRAGEIQKTYAITASGNEDQGNYHVTFLEGTFTINSLKTETVVTPPKAKTDLLCSGTSQVLVEAGAAEGGTLYYAVTESGAHAPAKTKYSTELPTAVEGGSYYVWFMARGDDDHLDTTPHHVTVDISRLGWIASRSIVLQNDITMKIYAEFVREPDEVPTLTVSQNGKDTEIVGVRDGKRYVFAYEKIYPHYISDEFTAVMDYVMDEKSYTYTMSPYSVREYCRTLLAMTDSSLEALLPATATVEETRRLIVDLLWFGAEGQRYMAYHTDHLATDGLSGEQLAFATDYVSPTKADGVVTDLLTGTEDERFYWYSTNVNLKNAATLRFFFMAPEGIEGLKVKVDGEEKKILKATAAGKYYVEITKMSAGSFGKVYTAVFEKDGGETGQTLHYSINTYISRMDQDAEFGPLARRLCNYGKSARAYATAE